MTTFNVTGSGYVISLTPLCKDCRHYHAAFGPHCDVHNCLRAEFDQACPRFEEREEPAPPPPSPPPPKVGEPSFIIKVRKACVLCRYYTTAEGGGFSGRWVCAISSLQVLPSEGAHCEHFKLVKDLDPDLPRSE